MQIKLQSAQKQEQFILSDVFGVFIETEMIAQSAPQIYEISLMI
jgi:hypothetical protein